jgi:hypothetical protein
MKLFYIGVGRDISTARTLRGQWAETKLIHDI